MIHESAAGNCQYHAQGDAKLNAAIDRGEAETNHPMLSVILYKSLIMGGAKSSDVLQSDIGLLTHQNCHTEFRSIGI